MAVPQKNLASIDRYRILSKLGEGGMATVYLAERRGAGGFTRKVALKVMHGELLSDPSSITMLMDEARIAGSVSHPNVVAVQDIFQTQQSWVLVLDLVDGLPLSSLLRHYTSRNKAFPLGVALRILTDVLAGVQAVHRLRGPDGSPLHVVHRDLTPRNILVGKDGRARVTDFGIADLTSRAALTAEGHVRGTVGYVAPERLKGRRADQRSDLYSLGVVLWELVTGKRLFSSRAAPSLKALLKKIRDGQVDSMRVHRANTPRELDAVCQQALCHQPEQRFASALDFALELSVAAERAKITAASRQELGALVGEALASRGESVGGFPLSCAGGDLPLSRRSAVR